MKKKANIFLNAGGVLSILAAFLHILIIIGGPKWYRFFGAGEGMAQLAEAGSHFPTLVTATIAMILLLWGLFAFSGAGIIRRLPLLKTTLLIISTIYILRGVLGLPLVLFVDHPYLNELAVKMNFMIISSIISLGIGLLYLKGLMQLWSTTMKRIDTKS